MSRILKEAYNLHPPTPRHFNTWKVSTVVAWLVSTESSNSKLPLIDLSIKIFLYITFSYKTSIVSDSANFLDANTYLDLLSWSEVPIFDWFWERFWGGVANPICPVISWTPCLWLCTYVQVGDWLIVKCSGTCITARFVWLTCRDCSSFAVHTYVCGIL